MRYLSGIELVDRCASYGVVTKDADGLPSILDFTCMDQDHWLLPVHPLSRVDCTPEKGGGNLTENIQIYIYRR